MKTTTTTATATATATATVALPLVVFGSSSLLLNLESPEGEKVENWGEVFRVMTEAHFQAAMNRAAAHGRDGGLPPQEW